MDRYFKKLMIQNKRVLILDDDQDILEALGLAFEMSDFDVMGITKAEKIVENIMQFKPNIIILDVLLSGTDGREICRMLKLMDETKGIPVIMISAHPDVERSTLEAGANNFFAKPFDINNLIDKADYLIN
jgi:DNA-binding response OmpR family regulator